MVRNERIVFMAAMAVLIGIWIMGGASLFAATSGSHYPFGGEGVLAGTTPPPGFHYRIYNTLYNPTTYKNDDGDKADIGFDLDVFSSVHRFVHVTGMKILGGDFIYNLIVPLVKKDVEIDAFGISDSKSLSMGDIVFEPIAIAWHRPRWDAVAALAVIAPTGEFESDRAASPGLGYWSGMWTLGGTVYFDAGKSWSLSALTRTLVHTEQEDTEVTPGSEFVVEYGLGKEIAINEKLLIRPGLSGCTYFQLTDDSDDAAGIVRDEKKQSHAIGAEMNLFWLPPTLFQLNLRVLREFDVKNNAEGSQFVITLTKSW